jgi:hypothetical protein
MASMRGEFAFEDGGRFYTCHVEPRRAGRSSEAWWWFGVSDDANRYGSVMGVTSLRRQATAVRAGRRGRTRHVGGGRPAGRGRRLRATATTGVAHDVGGARLPQATTVSALAAEALTVTK